MSYQLIDGKKIANSILDEVRQEADSLYKDHVVKPCLAVIIIGNNPASHVYVNHKRKACERVGFSSKLYSLEESITEKTLLDLIEQLNRDKSIHGILIQLPLPKHLHEKNILLAVDPAKDVDGFHPYNIGKMFLEEDSFLPCTPYGILELIKRSSLNVSGKHVVIVGRSNIVGKPMALLCLRRGIEADATVTVCHSKTENMKEITQLADILIVAIGKPLFIKENMVKKDCVVIDVGINRLEDNVPENDSHLVGDVDFNKVAPKCAAITPVPGGVGPMTIAMLLKNTLKATKLIIKNK